jgi:phage I-like protein
VALCGAVPLEVSDGKLPEWIHLLPAGKIRTEDGRGPYELKDVSAVIHASMENAGGKLAVDENHSTDIAAPKGQPSPARGWIVALEGRADGLWGKVEWNAQGIQLLADKAYRHISPVITHLKNKTITGILRASLTNRPNLRGLTALNQETDMDELQQIRELLGIKDDADDGAALEAIKALQAKQKSRNDTAAADETPSLQAVLDPIAEAAGLDAGSNAEAILGAVTDLADPAKRVDAEAVKSLQAKLATLESDRAREKAEAAVDAAIREGKPGVKPLREHYVSRHMQDPDAVEKELAAMPSITGSSGASITPPTGSGETSLDASHAQVAQLMGIDPDEYKKTLAEEAKAEETL